MNIFETPESGKKLDANGGRKLATDLTPLERENRLALLQQFYCDPLNEGEESAFDDDGLAITPPYGDVGPKFAMPVETPSEEGEDEARFFTVNRTLAWGVEFDPANVPADE